MWPEEHEECEDKRCVYILTHLVYLRKLKDEIKAHF